LLEEYASLCFQTHITLMVCVVQRPRDRSVSTVNVDGPANAGCVEDNPFYMSHKWIQVRWLR